jgi:hypothetical protein
MLTEYEQVSEDLEFVVGMVLEWQGMPTREPSRLLPNRTEVSTCRALGFND